MDQELEKTGLIKWEDKNGDGRKYAKDERNEMTIDRDIMVLANPEICAAAAHRADRGGRTGGGVVDGGRPAHGDFLRRFARFAEEGGDAQYHRETGAVVRSYRPLAQ
ncbi:MAG: hypothetical protein R3F18_06750 [Lysobacterales bacterium]